MKKIIFAGALALMMGTAVHAAPCSVECNPYLGRWALTLPGNGPGWLGVEKKGDQLKSSILWYGGSVVPTAMTKFADGKLQVIRKHRWQKDGKKFCNTETITAMIDGDQMKLSSRTVNQDGKQVGKSEFTGKRIPPVPPHPDLTKIKYGKPVQLFQKDNLDGWVLMNTKAPNGWSMKDGVLSNRVKGPDGKRRSCTNIKTAQTFEDFNLKTDVRMMPGGNSGIYLRGIYEIQMSDSYGQRCDSHHMGALYSRITPTVAAEKPAKEWQHIDITLVDRHVTVILNGQKIIDNQPVLGCTGGALTSDEFKPGPLYLQGDHSDVDYRNMVLTPILK